MAMDNNLRELFDKQGFVHLAGFFNNQDIERVRADAKWVFLKQMASRGFETHVGDEREFERGLFRYFSEDTDGFVNCGKTCQHLISLHSLSLRDDVVRQLIALGIKKPNICTRPVLYFNSRHLASSEVYYKSPPHQDWRSMQGSLNAIVIWVPLVDISHGLGTLEIIPGSHVWGLLDSREDEWYRRIDGLNDEQYQSVEVRAGDALFFSAFLVHRSGNNVSDSIRWSCHFRYNDLEESTFVSRKYPNPYTYKPQQELVTANFPSVEELRELFSSDSTMKNSAASTK
jgi:phytanoyl-CoA hydroxylase